MLVHAGNQLEATKVTGEGAADRAGADTTDWSAVDLFAFKWRKEIDVTLEVELLALLEELVTTVGSADEAHCLLESRPGKRLGRMLE